jgi:hypothetical protein
VKVAEEDASEFDLSKPPAGIASWPGDSLKVPQRSLGSVGATKFPTSVVARLAMHEARLEKILFCTDA